MAEASLSSAKMPAQLPMEMTSDSVMPYSSWAFFSDVADALRVARIEEGLGDDIGVKWVSLVVDVVALEGGSHRGECRPFFQGEARGLSKSVHGF